MLLIINNQLYGVCESYQQDRQTKQWFFKMNHGVYIAIDFDKIQSFESSGKLDITLKNN